MVSGRVQGVGYRAFVVRQAALLGVTGTVANLPDGRVEVVAEGGTSRLTELLKALRKGPWGADVTDVEAHWGQATGCYSSFRVAYPGGSLGRYRPWRSL